MAQMTCKDTWQDEQIFFHQRVAVWLAQTLQFAPQSLSTALHQCLLSAQVGAFCFGLHMRSQPHKFLILHLTEIRIAKMIHAPCTFNLSKMSHVWFCCIFPPSALHFYRKTRINAHTLITKALDTCARTHAASRCNNKVSQVPLVQEEVRQGGHSMVESNSSTAVWDMNQPTSPTCRI